MAEQSHTEVGCEQLGVVMSFSNLNLPERFIATADVEWHRQILNQIELGTESALYSGGYEITPTRRLIIDSLRGEFNNRYAMSNKRRFFASRLHQTWPERPIPGIKHAPSLRSAAINCAAYVLMPETHGSLESVGRMSRQLKIAPVVVYADQRDDNGELVDFNQYYSRYGYMRPETQIAPEVIEATDARSNFRNFHNSIWRRGIRGVIIDNHHLVRGAYADPETRLPWRQVLQSMEECGTLMSGMHVSAGRQDSKHAADKERSQTELTAIFNGPQAIGETVMGEVLAESFALWQRQRDRVYPVEAQLREENQYRHTFLTLTPALPVTVEVPYRGLVAYRKGERVDQVDFVSMHNAIGQSLQEFFASLSFEAV